MSDKNKKVTASVNDAIAKIVSDYFEQLGSKDELFSTTDGNVFENLGFAQNHATTLKDKNVTPHTNPKVLEVVDEEDLTDNEDKAPLGSAATQTNK